MGQRVERQPLSARRGRLVTVHRPCLRCSKPTTATRCADCEATESHQRDTRRGSRHERGYDSRWTRLSAQARRLQPFCSDCGSAVDLQVHHKTWPARGLKDVEVVCARCHATRPAIRTLGGNPPDPRLGTPVRGIVSDTHSTKGSGYA